MNNEEMADMLRRVLAGEKEEPGSMAARSEQFQDAILEFARKKGHELGFDVKGNSLPCVARRKCIRTKFDDRLEKDALKHEGIFITFNFGLAEDGDALMRNDLETRLCILSEMDRHNYSLL